MGGKLSFNRWIDQLYCSYIQILFWKHTSNYLNMLHYNLLHMEIKSLKCCKTILHGIQPRHLKNFHCFNLNISTSFDLWIISVYWESPICKQKLNIPQDQSLPWFNYAEAYLMLIANSPPSFCRTRKVPSDRDINRFLAAVRSMFPAYLQAQWQSETRQCNFWKKISHNVQHLKEKLNLSMMI